jgi:hypothetical protein
MKTKKILVVVALLVASTTLWAERNASAVIEPLSVNKTEELAKQFNLSKKQAKKVLTINQKYEKKKTMLDAQRFEIDKLGYLDESVWAIYFQTLSRFENEKKEALKSIVGNEQWIAFEDLLTETN